MPEFSDKIISLFNKRAATEQGGLLSGKDPTEFNSNDPIRLWIIQLGIIVSTASLLSLGLSKIRQPKVIAEVIGGILLGPTALGRIPGFTHHIFPEESISYLSLVANIGLCLFLFLVGLEIDAGVIKRNARLSAAIAFAGMALPFGIGVGISKLIYAQFVDSSVKFTNFMLFTGVAYSITAFPVLARILTELKLLDTTVGIVVLSAGVGNDIVGWTLLALSVALVNAGTGLTALYILLSCVGWSLFMLFPVKYVIRLLARKTGSIENGPTLFFMTVTMITVFGSAFFTDVIGVHAIFGAFLTGLVVPREGGLAITLTEKLEDMVAIVFLPLYFTLSGLNTDLGLLNDGITWGYTILIMVTAFSGKFGGCMLAARYVAGFNWRESGTIGSLMSCKGLVELIVLNVGLSAGILSKKVFSMFVLEALVLTFMTTPVVTTLYPPKYRTRIDTKGPDFSNVSDREAHQPDKCLRSREGELKTRFTIVLDKLEHVPGIMAMTQLLQPPPSDVRNRSGSSVSSSASSISRRRTISLEALRLIELSDRVSAVMKSSVTEALVLTDPLLSIFRMYGQLYDMDIKPVMSIVKYEDLAHSVVEHAHSYDSDMIMLPWLPPTLSATDSTIHSPPTILDPETPKQTNNPFDMLFKSSNALDMSASVIHSHFVRGVFMQAKTDVALFVDQCTHSVSPSSNQHIFLPFFGGPDDRLALEIVAQICENPRITATVVRMFKRDIAGPIENIPAAHLTGEKASKEINNNITVTSAITTFPDTVYGHANTETRLLSETADNIAWAKYTSASSPLGSKSPCGTDRMEFKELASPVPLHAAIQEATIEVECRNPRLIVVTGRSRRLAVENHRDELKGLMEEYENVGSEVRKTLGDVATAFISTKRAAGIIVVQASGNA